MRPGQKVLRVAIGTIWHAVGRLFSWNGSHPPNGTPLARLQDEHLVSSEKKGIADGGASQIVRDRMSYHGTVRPTLSVGRTSPPHPSAWAGSHRGAGIIVVI
jgi:hypothetical protein